MNDTHGHEAGDHVLKELAGVMSGGKLLRKRDVLGRYGGEEFVVLLPDTTGAAAVEIAEVPSSVRLSFFEVFNARAA